MPNCNTCTVFIPILLTQHHNILPVCITKNKISDYASSIQCIQLCMICIILFTRQGLYDLRAVLIYANGQNEPSATIGYSFNRHDNQPAFLSVHNDAYYRTACTTQPAYTPGPSAIPCRMQNHPRAPY